MKNSFIGKFLILLCLLVFPVTAKAQANKDAGISARSEAIYLEPDLFSDDKFHYSLNGFTPDGKTMIVSRSDEKFELTAIMFSSLNNNRWSELQLMPFSDGKSDTGASLNQNGSKLFFTSQRATGIEGIKDPWNLWMTEKTVAGWSQPIPLSKPVNSEHQECCAVAVKKDVVYFSSNRAGSWDIYRAELKNGAIADVEKLSGDINTQYDEWCSYLDDKEKFMIFSSTRPGGAGGDDIYAAYRKNKVWEGGKNLGELVNTKEFEDGARLSPDKKYLFFSGKNDKGLSRIKRIERAKLKDWFVF